MAAVDRKIEMSFSRESIRAIENLTRAVDRHTRINEDLLKFEKQKARDENIDRRDRL